MAAAGGGSPESPSGLYYRRKKKVSKPNSDLSLHSWGCGSVTKDLEDLYSRKVQLLKFLSTLRQPTPSSVISGNLADTNMAARSMEQKGLQKNIPVVVLDSDDEDGSTSGYKQLTPEKEKLLITPGLTGAITTWVAPKAEEQVNRSLCTEWDQDNQIVPYGQLAAPKHQFPLQTSWQPSVQYEKVILNQKPEQERIRDLAAASHAEKIAETQVSPALPKDGKRTKSDSSPLVAPDAESAPRKRKRKNEPDQAAVNFPVESDSPAEEEEPIEEEENPEKESDGLEDFWKEYSLAQESSKLEEAANEKEENAKELVTDCNHDIRIHEDLGHVCRVCGMIVRRADTIIDYQWKKASRARSYFCESRSKDAADIDIGTIRASEDFIVSDIAIHPRHAKHMRAHQLEGFNFLIKNLASEKPGGCILAHAPGSGKTFMLISFIQSFLARHPNARPLVILPKGILGTWKKEFQQWQVEDIPLHDFYSVKADKRADQLEILKSWQANMSVLFLGYSQFSRIICTDGGDSVAAMCRDMLLKVPGLLILDEGHTPRNRETDVLESLSRIQTTRKVVLSGTLFQNHVEEVFNILNLVRPKFLKMESSRPIVKRIMSQVEISGSRTSKGFADNVFTDSVEETLLHDGNFTRKAHVIRSLRELTKDVLHYYKGDILDELPGLVDFSVFLKLSPKQKEIARKLETYKKFKRSAVGTAVYMHPCLSGISEVDDAADRANSSTDAKVDSLIQSINVSDGVKARFFLNILALANSAGEKLLAFSQYILPMKFLERLLVMNRGWRVGKEIFVISGDTSPDDRELAMDLFNNSADAKVLFGSIKACGEGISLVGASRVVILDVHLNPSVTRQAIGRAFRPGQKKKVYIYRLVAADSPEEDIHETAFKKEVIPKLWFEWSEHCTTEDFKLNQVDLNDSEDELLDTSAMRQDIKALYRR